MIYKSQKMHNLLHFLALLLFGNNQIIIFLGIILYVFNLELKNLHLHRKVLFVLSHKLNYHIYCNRDIKYLLQ